MYNMNYLILFNVLTSLFSTITAMELAPKKSHTWVITQDKQIINVDKPIAHQSNLITVLQEKYAGTNKKPIPIPVNKNDLNFFCNSITQYHNDLVNQLSDKDYSQLMGITEKLKSPLFYAELIEPLVREKKLLYRFAYKQFNHAELKKIIFKKCLKKKSIKNNHNNGTNTFSLSFSNDGNYFTETVTKEGCGRESYLWDAKKLSPITEFGYIKSSTHGRINDYLITDDSVYFIKQNKLVNMNHHSDYNKYHISPDGRFFIPFTLCTLLNRSPNLCDTRACKEYPLLIPEDAKSEIKAFFHPNNTTLIYTTENSPSNYITIHDLKDPNKQQTKVYSKIHSRYNRKLAMSTDGSLLLLNHNILLNIQDPYNPIIVKEWEFNTTTQQTYEAFFIPHKNILVYSSNCKTLCLIDNHGDTIATYKAPTPITKAFTDNSGNYLAFLIGSTTSEASSDITLWNLSHLPSHINITKIKTDAHIHDIAFTKDQLLLTQSYTTKLWDMNGDEVLDLGQSNAHGINPQTGSIITAHNLSTIIPTTDYRSHIPISGPTKMYCYDINTQQAISIIKNITESLTLCQALLLNKYLAHRKTKHHHKLYPNLPDGRALTSFITEYKYLINNLILNTTEYAPMTKHD